MNNWLLLNTPYNPIWQTVGKLDSKDIFILTNKNKSAVLKISEANGIKLIEENIFTGETGESKSSNLKKICDLFKPIRPVIIDDSFKNLLEIATNFPSIDTKLVLATWGYTNSEQIKLAASKDFETMNQKSFVARYLC